MKNHGELQQRDFLKDQWGGWNMHLTKDRIIQKEADTP
jgi:hypothetical protein